MVGFYDPAPLGKDSFPGTLLSDGEVEYRLNIAPGSIEKYREKLQTLGFPEPVALIGERWDAGAVWQWQQAMAHMKRHLPSPETIETLAAIDAVFDRDRGEES
jgi:hypothetical protein